MSVRLCVGGRSAYTFLSTESAQEFVEAQSEAVRRTWPLEIRIKRDRNGPQDNGPRQPELPRPSPPRAKEVPADEDV